MNRIAPDWLIQVVWWISGIFATGALWYFLSTRDYGYATGSGAIAALLALSAVCLHRHNDKLAEQALPAEYKQEVLDNYIRRSIDDSSDLRLLDVLPELKAIAYRTARPSWDSGVTLKMRQATHDVIDFYQFVWLRLAEFYPGNHFAKDGADAYIRQLVRDCFRFHWAKHEPNGPGTGGTIVGVLTGGDVLADLDRLIMDTATAVFGYADDINLSAWLARWKDADSSQHGG